MKDHWVEKFGPKKIFALMTASFMLVSTSAYAVKESKLATAYSATLYGHSKPSRSNLSNVHLQ